jgi:four helix bundle protein
MGNFQKLRVWQLSKDLAVKIYKLCQNTPVSKDFSFKDQIQRAAVSISSNIAEGDELGTNKQSVRHLYIAKGSCAELMTQIIIGMEIDYIKKPVSEILLNDCSIVSTMLMRLIRARGGRV